MLTRRTALFAVLLLWCGALLAVRVLRAHNLSYVFLVWNLFLAVIPAVAAVLLRKASRPFAQVAWFAVWLLFLPNAPYVITDLVHLRARPPVPLWYDVALLISCGGTGLLLGYSSLAEVQSVIAARFGRALSWIIAAAALLLSGFGIYLGRFLRWNSWDALSHPAALLADIAHRVIHPFGYPITFAVTLIYGIALTLGYVALRVVSDAASSVHSSN
jgi:uncharacterized membrane protein